MDYIFTCRYNFFFFCSGQNSINNDIATNEIKRLSHLTYGIGNYLANFNNIQWSSIQYSLAVCFWFSRWTSLIRPQPKYDPGNPVINCTVWCPCSKPEAEWFLSLWIYIYKCFLQSYFWALGAIITLCYVGLHRWAATNAYSGTVLRLILG